MKRAGSALLGIAGLALMWASGFAAITEVRDASEAILKGDYTAGAQLLAKPVAALDRDALMLQGVLHASGAGAAYEYPLALDYWRKAAFAGQRDAARLLVPSLSNQYAREWWRERIATMPAPAVDAPKPLVHEERGGLVVDHERANRWIAQEAESGNPVGLYNAYHAAGFRARNNESSKARVRRLLERAAELKLTVAMRELSSQLEQAFPMPAAMSLNFPQDGARAAELMHEAADLGDGDAQLLWAHSLNSRKSAVRNPAAAVEYYRKSSEQGNAYAAYFLYQAYTEGEGVERDAAKAGEYLRLSARRGCDLAVDVYAQRLFRGKGVEADQTSAVAMLEQSLVCSSTPDADALALVAYAYASGLGVEKSTAKALWWGKWASDRGSTYAQKLVAQLTEQSTPPKPGLSADK